MKENTKQYLFVTVVGVNLYVALMNLPAVMGFAGRIIRLVLPISAEKPEDPRKTKKNAEEYVCLLALDTKCRVLGIFEVGHGTVNACLLHTREIMIKNLLCAASAFIVIHNHPSGELSVSRDDVSTTKKLYEAGELI